MKFADVVSSARDALTVRRVFGEPHTVDGTTVITAARVVGGGGGGGGVDGDGREGEGAGFGMLARPSGAYVIKDGVVKWVPAIDVNRAISASGVVVVAALYVRLRRLKAQR